MFEHFLSRIGWQRAHRGLGFHRGRDRLLDGLGVGERNARRDLAGILVADFEVRDKYSGKVATRVALADAAAVEGDRGRGGAEAPCRAGAVRATGGARALRRALPRARGGTRARAVHRGRQADARRARRGHAPDRHVQGRRRGGRAHRRRGDRIWRSRSARRATAAFASACRSAPCSFITPFNFPLNLVAHKVAPAIAAGCPFVLKPSERTPVGALIIGEVLAETRPPARRVLRPARALAERHRAVHRRPRSSCCRSPAREGRLGPQGARRPQEGGAGAGRQRGLHRRRRPGRALDAVVERLVFGAYYQSGQSCISVQRMLVHASLYDEMTQTLRRRRARSCRRSEETRRRSSGR